MSSGDGNGSATQDAEMRLHVAESGEQPADAFGSSGHAESRGAEQGGLGEGAACAFASFLSFILSCALLSSDLTAGRHTFL